jgi:GntR family transcriptional regulator
VAEPLYRQIADELRRKILSGELKAGMQLPTDDQLMEEYHVSKGTVRAAHKELERRELVFSSHRKGTFVSERVRPIVITLTSDLETGRGGGEGRFYATEVAASGRDPQMGKLQVGIAKARPEIAELLEIHETADVIVRHEEGYVDGLPWLLRTSYYPRHLQNRAPRLLQTSNIDEGAVAYLAGLGIEQGGYRDEIECRTPSETETSYFGLPADGHIQVFEIRRIAFDQNGNRNRLTVTIWRADRSKFAINVGDVPTRATGQA